MSEERLLGVKLDTGRATSRRRCGVSDDDILAVNEARSRTRDVPTGHVDVLVCVVTAPQQRLTTKRHTLKMLMIHSKGDVFNANLQQLYVIADTFMYMYMCMYHTCTSSMEPSKLEPP